MKPITLLSLACILSLTACDPFETANQSEMVLNLPEVPFAYNVSGTTDHLPTLGRVLFYDPRLSINNSVSCASCHKQALAFSDNSAFSRGFENRITPRNSMPIQNIISSVFQGQGQNVLVDSLRSDSLIVVNNPDVGAYLPGVVVSPDFFSQPTKLFWDGRENDLATMVTRPIMNHIEMGISDLDVLAAKLSSIKEYNSLFSKAFGNEEITKEKIAQGLSAFLLSIRSTQSKFDKSVNFAITNNSFTDNKLNSGIQLSAIEELGRQLFFDKFNCNNCHESNGFADVGLDATPKDLGVSVITGNAQEGGQFKIPSLRNVQLTGPYMHDGRFKTLEEVLQHYSHGINNSTNLDVRLKENGKAKQMNMTDAEVKAIIAFMNTLTDYEMITDPKLSNPFNVK